MVVIKVVSIVVSIVADIVVSIVVTLVVRKVISILVSIVVSIVVSTETRRGRPRCEQTLHRLAPPLCKFFFRIKKNKKKLYIKFIFLM